MFHFSTGHYCVFPKERNSSQLAESFHSIRERHALGRRFAKVEHAGRKRDGLSPF
jgi:hypothetical protein